jgi:uncharacterized BrkB/YihY/UPF0761 family membrane protein
MIIVVSIFLLVTFLINPLLGSLQRLSDENLPTFLSMIVHSTMATFFPIIIMTVLFFYLFKSLPHERIPWKVAALSTVITVTLVEIMRYVFVFYLERISSLGAVYGTYAFIAVVALWAYYVALVFTIGAVFGKLYYLRLNAKM